MGSTDSQVLQKQYAARWLELKHILTAKYFSDRDLAGNRACLPECCLVVARLQQAAGLQSLSLAGKVNDEEEPVAGVQVRLAQEPPLKRFLKTPRLKEDLAKCALSAELL